MNKLNIEKLKKLLPSTPGILRKEEYFNSAVLIPLVYTKGEYHLLFEKRSENIRQGGEICFPGGEYDRLSDKSFEETAIREAEEELGISRNEINIIGAMDTLIGPMGVTVDSFIAELKIDGILNLKYDKNEVAKVFLVPVSYFLNNPAKEYFVRLEVHSSFIDKNGMKVELLPVKELNLPQRYHNPWGGRKRKIYVYQTEGEVIWGITAELIKEVIKKIELSRT